ncbi:MAG: hypothetical protein EAZ07_00765 [Cytophagales bacterium]|nr:MAG: hypothetical protein EAZ07_00765 [Cytophagales bacterium]
MKLIKKETIIKKGDHLIEPNGEKWEVKEIEGLYFTIAHLKNKNQKLITKEKLMGDNNWQMVIMDNRNYW